MEWVIGIVVVGVIVFAYQRGYRSGLRNGFYIGAQQAIHIALPDDADARQQAIEAVWMAMPPNLRGEMEKAEEYSLRRYAQVKREGW
jgi:hypothetical protein